MQSKIHHYEVLTQYRKEPIAALGYGAMTDLERFYIDSPVYDEDDFWQDIRPHG